MEENERGLSQIAVRVCTGGVINTPKDRVWKTKSHQEARPRGEKHPQRNKADKEIPLASQMLLDTL